jgi:hypothetical protein
MNRIRRSAAVIVGLAVSIIGLVAAAPDAFAMRLLDNGGSAPYTPAVTVVHHSGASTWQVTLIAVLAAAVAAGVTAIALRVHSRTTRLRPAAG